MKDEFGTDYPESAMLLIGEPKLARKLSRLSIALTIVLLLCLLLPWTQNIRSEGSITTLRPQDRPQDLQAVIGGRIEEWFVGEGQFVSKGDIIALLSEVKEKFLDMNLLRCMQE